MLINDEVEERPSDFDGIWYLSYKSIDEISEELKDFLDRLIPMDSKSNSNASEDLDGVGSITEVVRVSTSTGSRNWEYDQVVDDAKCRLVVTGIGMINFIQQLESRLREMDEKENLSIDFLILDKKFVAQHQELVDAAYRPGLYQNLVQFEEFLFRQHQQDGGCLNSILERTRLYRYCGFMSFVATVSDPGSWGSMMLVETVLPSGKFGHVERPRLLLRRRVANGLYDRYWKAINEMKCGATLVNRSKPVSTDEGGKL